MSDTIMIPILAPPEGYVFDGIRKAKYDELYFRDGRWIYNHFEETPVFYPVAVFKPASSAPPVDSGDMSKPAESQENEQTQPDLGLPDLSADAGEYVQCVAMGVRMYMYRAPQDKALVLEVEPIHDEDLQVRVYLSEMCVCETKPFPMEGE